MGYNFFGVRATSVSSSSALLKCLELILGYSPNHPSDAPPFILPSPLPSPPRKERPASPMSVVSSGMKRSAPDDDVEEPASKRPKTNGAALPNISSPSKRRQLEEEGLILMKSATDTLEDDIIVID